MMMVNILVLDSVTNPITMIQGLVWLLPFLYFGYLFEIYNAYALYYIYIQVKFCKFDGSLTLFDFSSLMQLGTWLPCPFSSSCLGLVKMTCSQMRQLSMTKLLISQTPGNLITVSMTIPKKLKDRTHSLLKYRFTRSTSKFITS